LHFEEQARHRAVMRSAPAKSTAAEADGLEIRPDS
jgi:hypothetical protein